MLIVRIGVSSMRYCCAHGPCLPPFCNLVACVAAGDNIVDIRAASRAAPGLDAAKVRDTSVSCCCCNPCTSALS